MRLKLENLIGLTILSSKINFLRNTIQLNTDKGIYFLNVLGDCCAKSYVASCYISNTINNVLVTGVEEKSYINGDPSLVKVIDTFGLAIKTNKGYLDLDFRAEHNGYYNGYIVVSKDKPENEDDEDGYSLDEDFVILKDF